MKNSPSIALVVLDTLRYDAFERHFDWLNGKTFTYAFSTSHHSIPAHASLFTGRYPSEIGVHVKSPSLNCANKTISEKLKEEGYSTYGFHENGQIANWEGWSRGFDHFLHGEILHENRFDWNSFARNNDYTGVRKHLQGVYQCIRSDSNTYGSLLEGYKRFTGDLDVLKENIELVDFEPPAFLFMNLMDAHQPYSAPDDFYSFDEPVRINHVDSYRGIDYDKSHVRRAYDEAVSYLSYRYNKIHDRLREKFDYIITVADHGEMLGEYNKWSHSPGIYPQITHIPIIITGPDIPNEECDLPVSLLDVYAIISDLADLENDSRGQSIINPTESEPRMTEYHGSQPWQFKKFQECGIADKYHELDIDLRGIVGEDFYGYETVDGFQTVGASPWENPQQKLREVSAEIPAKEPDDSWLSVEQGVAKLHGETLSDDVQQRLENLGYM